MSLMARFVSGSIFLAFYLAPFIATGYIAHKKNRNTICWIAFAFFAPILAWIAVLIVSPIVPCKRCPECRRFSRASTVTCPFCNKPLPDQPIEDAPDPAGNNNVLVTVLLFVVVGLVSVSIIGILAAIAIPNFIAFHAKSQEANTRIALQVMRTTISLYSNDSDTFPKNLEVLTKDGKYIATIPPILIPKTANNPGHPLSAAITYGSSKGSAPTDIGGWYYDNAPSDSNFGKLMVNCTHTDSKNKRWDSY